MKKRILSLFFGMILCLSLAVTASAAEGFDASVDMDRSVEGQVSVTVNADDAILAEKVPTLSVTSEFDAAKVLFEGNELFCTVKDGMVSFPVAKKGTYVIQGLYSITFQNDGAEVASLLLPCGAAVEAPADPVRVGYTFAGWDAEVPATMPAEALTLTAQWDVNQYTITFINRRTLVHATITQDYGTAVQAPANPIRHGYIFTGWDQDVPATMPAEDLIITARWEEVYYDDTPIEPVRPETPDVTTGTVLNKDGSVTTTVTDSKAGTVTETTEYADGMAVVVTTDAAGESKSEVLVSEKAVAAAAESGTAVALPISAMERGAVITVTTNSGENTTVAIPVAEVSSSTVAILVNEDGTETVITETKMTENGLVVDVPDGATVKIVDNSIIFKDVGDSDWEKDAVDFASARGLVNGVGNDNFDLDGITTRAHVVTLLARLAGVDTTPDAGKDWHHKGEEWAVANSITYAGNMDKAITRHEMMTLLWRFVGSPDSDHDISHFTDTHELTAYTEEAARWAVEIGLVQGNGNNTMTPTGVVTRGQLAQFMMNFIQFT